MWEEKWNGLLVSRWISFTHTHPRESLCPQYNYMHVPAFEVGGKVEGKVLPEKIHTCT